MNSRGPLRRRAVQVLCATVCAAALLVAALLFTEAGWRTVTPMATTVVVTFALLGWWPRTRPRLVPAALVVASTTGAATAVTGSPRSLGATGLMALVEIAVSLLMIFMVVRFATPRRSAAAATALALSESTVTLRLETPANLTAALGQCALFMLAGGVAALVGSYLRSLDARRLRSVGEARKAQRMQLAADLHDFVAHDVSGIVVLAQAGQVMGEAARPEQLLPLLQRIEAAGLQALASLDRTVLMLNDSPARTAAEPGEVRPSPYGLADITDLVERFRSSSRSEVEYDCDVTGEAADAVPREVAATAHRLVAEALTNVRRHAVSAMRVRVFVRMEGAGQDRTLLVGVVNGNRALTDGALGSSRLGGGTGLAGLEERVVALGGTLGAGPHGTTGWQVRASFPLAGAVR
ncbi:histidine kinase [Streptomyces luteosporeus]|uniref:histidine kinase n=2 Tax=Streptomyces TaxID=1883 RepID=A0ABN3TMG8_9ACTN